MDDLADNFRGDFLLENDRLEADFLHLHNSLPFLRFAKTATDRESRELIVGVCSRMGHSKRTTGSIAIPKLDRQLGRRLILCVASFAEVMSAVAEKDGYTAAEETLPLDMLSAMIGTN